MQLIPDRFKTQEICDKVLRDDSSYLQFVPDWFVTNQGVDLWYDHHCDDDGNHWDYDDEDEWCDVYKKQKAQKVLIKEKLLPTMWHSSRYWDWCMSG